MLPACVKMIFSIGICSALWNYVKAVCSLVTAVFWTLVFLWCSSIIFFEYSMSYCHQIMSSRTCYISHCFPECAAIPSRSAAEKEAALHDLKVFETKEHSLRRNVILILTVLPEVITTIIQSDRYRKTESDWKVTSKSVSGFSILRYCRYTVITNTVKKSQRTDEY